MLGRFSLNNTAFEVIVWTPNEREDIKEDRKSLGDQKSKQKNHFMLPVGAARNISKVKESPVYLFKGVKFDTKYSVEKDPPSTPLLQWLNPILHPFLSDLYWKEGKCDMPFSLFYPHSVDYTNARTITLLGLETFPCPFFVEFVVDRDAALVQVCCSRQIVVL
jgi:hypothetical protein